MEGTEDLEEQVPKDSSAYGARNVRIVAAGTGEALPGPADCVKGLERGDL
jgi:ABC-type tungstate transport system permease subunit